MRFALADVKKTISRRGGDPVLLPYLLRPGERLRELEGLIGLFEGWLGAPRATFHDDRPSELIGDYRLARCLVQCLSEWYTWRIPQWPGPAQSSDVAALAASGIGSPAHLRLALYEYVNGVAGGFLPTATRDAHLDTFAATCGLARATLDVLLALDAERNAILERTAAAAPTAHELAARYNQRAVESVLANAAAVEWVVPAGATDRAVGGRGTIVKRVCFLARCMGIQYEVAFDVATAAKTATGMAAFVDTAAESAEWATDDPRTFRRVAESRAHYAVGSPGNAPAADVSSSLDSTDQPLTITLFGPQEVTGAANQYGERLSRLCTALLGYRRGSAAVGDAALAVAGLRGSAKVYLYGRPMTFHLDDRLLKLLQPVRDLDVVPDAVPDKSDDDEFDSSLERHLYTEFTALERAGEAHGWRLEREPEPVLVGDTIMVPDFALVRGARRVFLEIAGYWRPEYRERKVRKLRTVRGRVALILAVPEAAAAEFAPLVSDWPLIWYKHHVSARAILALLEQSFNDVEQRLALLDVTHIQEEVARRGVIPPAESLVVLHCYTRNELARALSRLRAGAEGERDDTPIWIESVGLCSLRWRDDVLRRIRAVVANARDQRVPLAALVEVLAGDGMSISAQAAEALSGEAGLTIVRASIFGIEVAVAPDAVPVPSPATGPHLPPDRTQGHRSQPRRSATRKTHSATWNTPSIFEVAQSDDDRPVPGTPTRAPS